MATTYKDYYIDYNGTRISNNEDTGKTAVNIYYNGTYIGEGTHTLNCSGKYMDGNVQIGDRTLNCSGKYMDGNVQVTTQARYKWRRYSSHYGYYSYVNRGPFYYESGARLYNNLPDTCYVSGDSWSFDSSNGYWTIGDGYNEYISSRYGYPATYFARNGSNYDNVVAAGDLYGTRDAYGVVYFYAKGYTESNATYEYASAGTWYKDGQIDTVWSRSASAHSDGPDGNGYWYEAI